MQVINNKYTYLDKAVLYLVFGIFIFADQGNKVLIYSPFFILAIYHSFNLLLRRSKRKYYNKSFNILPFTLILAWFYGVYIGLVNNNDYVFINNVGIIFFFSYYFLSCNQLTANQIFKILFNLSLISSVIYLYNFDGTILFNLLSRQGGFALASLFPVVMIPYLFFYIFFSKVKSDIIKNRIVSIIIFLLFSFVAVFLVFSKGVLLSLIISIIFLFFTHFYNRKFSNFSWLLLFITVGLFYLNFYYSDNVITIFGSQEKSNELRYSLISDIINELTFFGHGWCAVYDIQFLKYRNGLGYSSELSYLNLIHKIGVFSFIYFYFYIWSFYHVIKCLKSNNFKKINIALVSLGLLTYLFLSLGNPTLFAPIFVFMHVLSIHLLNKSLIKNTND